MPDPKMIFRFIMFVASVAYQQRLYKKMQRQIDEQRGFDIPIRSQVAPIPVVYGKQLVSGIQTFHKVRNKADISDASVYQYLASGKDELLVSTKGFLPVSFSTDSFNMSSYASGEALFDNTGQSVGNPSKLHHRQIFNSHTVNMSSGGKNEFLVMQQVLSQGGINRVKHVLVDENDYDNKDARFNHVIEITRNGSNQPTSVQFSAFGAANDVPITNVMTDCSYATMLFKLNREDPNYNGIPNVQFLVEGRRIRDITRSGSAGSYTYALSTEYHYSNNPALVLLDYLLNSKFGRGLAESGIDLGSFYDAKVVCARTDMVYSGSSATTKLSPNGGKINTIGASTERLKAFDQISTTGSATISSYQYSPPFVPSSADILSGTTGNITLNNPSRISFTSYKSDGSNFTQNSGVKARVIGTDPTGAALTSQYVILAANTEGDSTDQGNTVYTAEFFSTVTSIEFTKAGANNFRIINLGIGVSEGINLPALYECNITIDTSNSIRNNIERILNTMGLAELTWSTEGKYKLQLAYPQTAAEAAALSVATFNRTNIIRENVSIGYNAASERFNKVTATFNNEFEDFKEDSVTFPKAGTSVESDYLDEDNNQPMATDVRLEGITNPLHALAKVEQIARVSRRLNMLTMTVDRTALRLEPGDFITVDLKDVQHTSGFADIDNELYRIESLGVKEDLTVEIKAYRFHFEDLAWNVADNVTYRNRVNHNFIVPAPTNLNFYRFGTDSYNAQLDSIPATLLNSSGRITWTNPSGISKFQIEVASVVSANYASASDLAWIETLSWRVVGETKNNIFDLPALALDQNDIISVDYDSIRTINNTTLSSATYTPPPGPPGPYYNNSSPFVMQPGDSNLNEGVLTSGLASAGTYFLEFTNPTHITFSNVTLFSNFFVDQSDSRNNVMFFVSGLDQDGNVVKNEVATYLADSHSRWKDITSQSSLANDYNNVTPQMGSSHAGNDGIFATRTAFTRVDTITFAGSVNPTTGEPNNGFGLFSNPQGTQCILQIGTIETKIKEVLDVAISVKSISPTGAHSIRVSTLFGDQTNPTPTSPTLVNIDPVITKIGTIFADSADQYTNNQSFSSTINGVAATHRAIFSYTGTLESLPIRPITRYLDFQLLSGPAGADGVATTTFRLHYTAASAGQPSGTFTGVTLTWSTGILSSIPSGWSQTAPTVAANNTTSFWFVDLIFSNTTGATTSTPSTIGTVQRVISFNNLVLFTGGNTNFSQELITAMSSGAGSVQQAVNNNVTGIIGSQITTGTINAQRITAAGITKFARTNGSDLFNMHPTGQTYGAISRVITTSGFNRTYVFPQGYGYCVVTGSFQLWGVENATTSGSFASITAGGTQAGYIYPYHSYLQVFSGGTQIAARGTNTPGANNNPTNFYWSTTKQGQVNTIFLSCEVPASTSVSSIYARLTISRASNTGGSIGTWLHLFSPKIDIQEFSR